MNKKYVAIFIALVALVNLTLVACGGRTAGNNSNLNNVNENLNSNDFVTRRLAVQGTANGIMGYQVDLVPCEENFSDIDGQSGHDTFDQFLCWSIDYLERRGFDFGFQDGTFRPEDFLPKAEIWKVVVSGMGLAPFKTSCAPDVPQDAWYARYAGALCEKELLIVRDTGAAPGESMTMTDWYFFQAEIRNYLDQPAYRQYVMEALLTILVRVPLYDTCDETVYMDVLPNSLVCHVTDVLLDEGLLDPSQDYFRPNDTVTWAEVSKMATAAAGLYETQCTGCSGLTTEHWACGWADALCEAGFLPEAFDANSTPTLRQAYELFWDLQTELFPANN